MKKILLVLFIVLMMVGCSGAKYRVSMDENGVMTEEFGFTNQGDGTYRSGKNVGGVFTGFEFSSIPGHNFIHKRTKFVNNKPVMIDIAFAYNGKIENFDSAMASYLFIRTDKFNGNKRTRVSTDMVFFMVKPSRALDKYEARTSKWLERDFTKVKGPILEAIENENGEYIKFVLRGADKKEINTSEWTKKEKDEYLEKMIINSMKFMNNTVLEGIKARQRRKVISNALNSIAGSLDQSIKKQHLVHQE